jgi:nitrite reductase/ring-hydroxylating ferredoxin subunit
MEQATLDVGAYTQGEAFQREKRSLFARAWLPFCAAGQVAEAGAFVSHSLGGWPLFLVRDKDGTLRAFHNTCRHQQMPVVEKPAGRCDMLRCRYHGWTYDLTGALAVAPPMAAPPDIKAVRLAAIEAAEHGPLVFVRVEPGTEAVPAASGLDGMRFAAAIATDAACNWKTAIEALLAEPGWELLWPIALRRAAGDVHVIRQIVPRSFSRTRFVDLVFTAGAVDEAAQAAITAAATADKGRAEALQERRAAGVLDGDAPVVREFQNRAAASAGPPA